jgi:hypothetical protein
MRRFSWISKCSYIINQIKRKKMVHSKFKKFKANKLQEQFRIIGGEAQASTYNSSDGSSGADCVDFDTTNQTADDGRQWDYSRGECTTAS